MSVVAPLAASSREPQKPRRLPKPIRNALVLMVRGDEDGRVIDFIAAAKRCGVAPDVMRRWLDRGEARQFLRNERQAWRAAICAANEIALRKIRDGENAMASVRAVQVLEQLDTEQRHAGAFAPVAGFCIVIGDKVWTPPSPPQKPTIDVTPAPAETSIERPPR
jgi:hypothetical protein